MKKNNPLYRILLVTLFLGSFTACKTSKKQSLIQKAYHNITAHYNGYFNAKLKIDQVAAQSEVSIKDQYDQLLPIYKKAAAASTGENTKGSKAGNQPLDEAIKKASFVIQRHEKSNWTDDCYFEIGRANYYKKDYFGAIESFQYVAGKYKNTFTGNKSYIWLINCYVELNKFQQAESVINIALGSETFPKKLLPDLFTSIANYHFVRKNYEKTIEYLEKTIPLERKKSNQARYTYLTAQLYEKINETGKAAIAYQKVLKYNPNYDMAFNARINSARLFESKSNASKKEIERSLNKMLKDEKNMEFKDQIYYSLANIYENQNNIPKAIIYYKLSSATSVNNTAQKGEVLFLTKPIDVGILATAQKRGVLLSEDEQILIHQLKQLNSIGYELGKIKGVTAMTDVTGFGLLGHLIEMAEGSGLSAVLNYNQLPVIAAARNYLQQRIIPDATYRNWNAYSSSVAFGTGVNVMEAFNLLPDPQTNGGLLFSVNENSVAEVQELLQKNSLNNFIKPIVTMIVKEEKIIRVEA